jgi:hypothetical protein
MITTVTRKTVPCLGSRALIVYVPAGSPRPRTRPLNGTLFGPAWPRTLNEPAARQTGEICVTVKTTRAASGSWNVSVVRRCDLGPCAAIHGRELRKRAIDERDRPRSAEPDEDPEPEEERDKSADAEGDEAMPAIGAVQT